MTKDEFLKSPFFKVLLPLAGALIVIAIARNGYGFGQWLYSFLHS